MFLDYFAQHRAQMATSVQEYRLLKDADWSEHPLLKDFSDEDLIHLPLKRGRGRSKKVTLAKAANV